MKNVKKKETRPKYHSEPHAEYRFKCSYFHELAISERHNVEVFYTQFHPNRSMNTDCVSRNSFVKCEFHWANVN